MFIFRAIVAILSPYIFGVSNQDLLIAAETGNVEEARRLLEYRVININYNPYSMEANIIGKGHMKQQQLL